MRRHRVSLFLIMLLVGTAPICARGAEFRDSASLYAVYIPDSWVYQAKESTPSLNVFYGAGESDLLYFETLENVSDQTAEAFGQRALQSYVAAGGLPEFRLQEPLSPVEVGGVVGVKCTYTYRGSAGTTLWEQRVFLILTAECGFSIALAGAESWDGGSQMLQDIIRGWRWYFED